MLTPPNHIVSIRLVCVWLSLLAFASPASSEDQWGYVRWVNDGDTVILSDGRRVRYIGIDTPEVARGQQLAEPYARAARRANRAPVYRKRIRMEVGRQPKDRYGRILAYVFLPDGRFVNEMLVRSGVAVVLPKAPNSKYEKRLHQAQQHAMSAGEGMWHRWENLPIAPIGNRHSKRFHHPACSRAGRMNPGRRVVFDRIWDAFWAGYAPAQGCLPNPIYRSP